MTSWKVSSVLVTNVAGHVSETECILSIWLGGNADNTTSVTCSADNLGMIAIEAKGAATADSGWSVGSIPI